MDNTVTVHWNEDLSIATITLTATNRACVDTYIETNMELLRNWEKGNPVYIIHNVAHENVNLTPYLRGRLNDLEKLIRAEKFRGCAAIVVSNNLTGNLIQAFFRLFLRNVQDVQQRVFTNMSAAQAWIEDEKQLQAQTK